MENSIINAKRANVLLAGVMALVVALTLAVPAGAYAATYSATGVGSAEPVVVKAQALTSGTISKTVNSSKFTTSTSTIKKKATAVKKGTTKLNVKSGQGFIKFTAPKKKAWSFTFSNLKSTKANKHVYGAFAEAMTQSGYSPKYSFMTDVSTKGGKHTTLYLAEKGYQDKSGKVVYRHLTSRTGKITLKKGQDIYFYFYSGMKNTSVTLKVS